MTPIGWASDKRSSKAMSVGKGGQKQRLSQAMKSLRHGLGIGGVFWTRWRDGGGGCKWCRHSGLLSKKGKAKPAWGAYKKFLKTLGTNPPPPPPELDPFFRGVVPDGWMDGTDAYLMKSAGVGAVRFIINWQQVASSGGFNWTKTDEEFKELAENGIEPLPQLFGNPNLVGETVDADGNPKPAVMNQWQAFVAATVARYKPGGKFWTDNPGARSPPAAHLAGLQRAEHPRLLAERAVAEQVRRLPPRHRRDDSPRRPDREDHARRDARRPGHERDRRRMSS